GIRFARSASAPLPPALLERFQRHTGVSVLETYGMTEVAGQIAANPLDAATRRPGSVGLPVGVDLEVATPDGLPVASGELGSVRLRGDAVVTHYLELTTSGPERLRPARDAGGWLTTGDLGRVDDAGFLHLAGREDDVINRGGEKFHPQEVERVLLDHPAVSAAAVVGAPHPRLGQVAVAFVGVHTVTHVPVKHTVAAGALTVVFHSSREIFFVVTALVLMHGYGRRAVRRTDFWRRRYLCVAVPYAVWTLVYMLADGHWRDPL